MYFPFHFRTKEPTSVLLNLSKAVYPIGDRIKLDVEVFNPQKRKVKNIQVTSVKSNVPFFLFFKNEHRLDASSRLVVMSTT